MTDKKPDKNYWLTDEKFLSNVIYEDPYYFSNLCNHIRYFVDHSPIPILTSWDYKNKRIYFRIGEVQKYIYVDNQIPYKESILLIKRLLVEYYPQYHLEKKISVPYTELPKKELLYDIKKGILTFDESFNKTKMITTYEYGVIDKIFMGSGNDEFVVESNEGRIARVTNGMFISTFLKEIRMIHDDKSIKQFIEDNSIVKEIILPYKNGSIEIRYKDKMLVNFIKINLLDMINEKLQRVSDLSYIWGKFILYFDSPIQIENIQSIIDNGKKKLMVK